MAPVAEDLRRMIDWAYAECSDLQVHSFGQARRTFYAEVLGREPAVVTVPRTGVKPCS
jgi:hypothetical protein